METQSLKLLADLPPNTCCTVHELHGGTEFVSRMSALGFTVGAKVKVVRNHGHEHHGHGPLIVMVRGTRVALGRGEALKVLVEETDNEHKPSA